MDTAIYYQRGRYRARVNFNNVLNSRYFVGAYDEVYVPQGAVQRLGKPYGGVLKENRRKRFSTR